MVHNTSHRASIPFFSLYLFIYFLFLFLRFISQDLKNVLCVPSHVFPTTESTRQLPFFENSSSSSSTTSPFTRTLLLPSFVDFWTPRNRECCISFFSFNIAGVGLSWIQCNANCCCCCCLDAECFEGLLWLCERGFRGVALRKADAADAAQWVSDFNHGVDSCIMLCLWFEVYGNHHRPAPVTKLSSQPGPLASRQKPCRRAASSLLLVFWSSPPHPRSISRRQLFLHALEFANPERNAVWSSGISYDGVLGVAPTRGSIRSTPHRMVVTQPSPLLPPPPPQVQIVEQAQYWGEKPKTLKDKKKTQKKKQKSWINREIGGSECDGIQLKWRWVLDLVNRFGCSTTIPAQLVEPLRALRRRQMGAASLLTGKWHPRIEQALARLFSRRGQDAWAGLAGLLTRAGGEADEGTVQITHTTITEHHQINVSVRICWDQKKAAPWKQSNCWRSCSDWRFRPSWRKWKRGREMAWVRRDERNRSDWPKCRYLVWAI